MCRKGRTYEHIKDKIRRELLKIIGDDNARLGLVAGATGGAATGGAGGSLPGAVVGGVAGGALGWLGAKSSTAGGNF